MAEYKTLTGDCLEQLNSGNFPKAVDLTFLDPPFNQNKEYAHHDDNLSPEQYWGMMKEVCQKTFDITSNGGAVYFMQREKNTEDVLRCLRETGWTVQIFVIWKKLLNVIIYIRHYIYNA